MRLTLEHVGVLDIDGTMLTKRMEREGATSTELAAAHFVRDWFNTKGLFTVATAQTAEMIMSEASYLASVDRGFKRPRPHLGGVPGKRFYLAPEKIASRVPFTDPDAIMSMGTGIRYRQKGGVYVSNKDYEDRLRPNWRPGAVRLLEIAGESLGIDIKRFFAAIEFEQNYHYGSTDVAPLENRIELLFDDTDTKNLIKNKVDSTLNGLRELEQFGGVVAAGLSHLSDVLHNLRIQDESDPSRGKNQFYATPLFASKEEMIDEALAVLTRGRMITNLLIAGDMPPDLRAGCFAGRALSTTFLLVGGSPLSPYLTRDSGVFGHSYAGESMRWLTGALTETRRPGFERLHRAGVPSRLFVIGDVAYPGLTGPETIAAFLKDEHKPTLY